MCQFEDWPIISRYTNQQAVEDGIKVEILRWNGIPVTVTAGVQDDFGLSELLIIWHEFCNWKDNIEQTLPEEERLFSTFQTTRKYGL